MRDMGDARSGIYVPGFVMVPSLIFVIIRTFSIELIVVSSSLERLFLDFARNRM